MSDHGQVARKSLVELSVPSRRSFRGDIGCHQLEEVAARFTERFPDIEMTFRRRGLHFAASGHQGFPIGLELIDGVPTVTLRGCQFGFVDVASASRTVALALTPASRLRIEYAGPNVHRWWLETCVREDKSETVLAGGMGWSVLRRKRRTVTLQNSLLETGHVHSPGRAGC